MSRPTLRERTGAPHARLWGLGSYRPERVVTNAEVCEWIESSDEWIRSRSGVVERRFARPDETLIDMSCAAAEDALAKAGVRPDQLGAVLVATVTHPFQTPSAATAVAHRIGAEPAAAMDLAAACAGYCHGISLAADMIRSGSAEFVLVIGAEKLSDFLDIHDRGTAFIFGDGAGAAVVGPSDVPGIGPVAWGSKGESWDVIRNKYSWTELREHARLGAIDEQHPADAMPWSYLTMAGQSVFRWAVYAMAPVCREALAAAGIQADDLDAFVPHQANLRIVDALVKQLRLPAHVPVADDIRHQGNTSSASVPLAMDRMLTDGTAPHGGLALQIGFGAGLVYAAQVVVLP
ncbi:beta-ketoacyl-ACP synthase III [Arsenicicoccus dermatophilus]|uniref:beta-ketoacyl-ACP synthase III n=1 Tax=Arsenicicoccus dermatophilus TaxID=1076331 RepID=UPI001F4C808E|nr:beta-ketoacyl-ACP synthase III [Arsenicicoccus dermatophilus]MCH8612757.1 ketoacyl-ACP synthase III [Arsenicicoccus dermatophilus]